MEWSDESAPSTPYPALGFAGLGICESSSSDEAITTMVPFPDGTTADAINAPRLRSFKDVEAAAR
jgi:hypothetical protein